MRCRDCGNCSAAHALVGIICQNEDRTINAPGFRAVHRRRVWYIAGGFGAAMAAFSRRCLPPPVLMRPTPRSSTLGRSTAQRRVGVFDLRRRQLTIQKDTLVPQRHELAQTNRLPQRVGAFAERIRDGYTNSHSSSGSACTALWLSRCACKVGR